MKRHRLSGVGAAIITPFKSDFSIDWDALAHMIDYVIEGGTNYIVALGTTAETPTLSPEEKNEIIRFTREHIAGRVPLVVGAGGNDTAKVIRQINWARVTISLAGLHFRLTMIKRSSLVSRSVRRRSRICVTCLLSSASVDLISVRARRLSSFALLSTTI